MSSARRPVDSPILATWLHWIAVVVFGLALAQPGAPKAGTLDEQVPEVVFSPALAPAVADKAVELGGDPVRIYEFVRNELAFQNYFGLMKGPEATLLSGGGNDYDLAALLLSLMRASGIPARFVRGRISVPSEHAMAWTGTDTPAAALDYLNNGAKFIWSEGSNLTLAHVWVEVQVPMAFYRGRGADPDARGKAWIALDPSFKLHTWPAADPNLVFGSTADLTFDYTGTAGLYATVQAKLPSELFEDQVRSYLAQHPSPGSGPPEIDEILLRGKIVKESSGVLPNSLPYDLTINPADRQWYARRGSTLAELHSNSSYCNTVPQPDPCSYWHPTEEYRYRASITVECIDWYPIPTHDCVDSEPEIVAEDWSVAWQGEPILLTFPPEDPSLVPDRGYLSSQCQGTDASQIMTRPRITAGSVVLAEASDPIEACFVPLKVSVGVQLRRGCPGEGLGRRFITSAVREHISRAWSFMAGAPPGRTRRPKRWWMR